MRKSNRTISMVLLAFILPVIPAETMAAMPVAYKLSFEEALKVASGQVVIKCLEVPTSRYDLNGNGWGVSGQSWWDSKVGERNFEYYFTGGPFIAAPAKYSSHWYSSLTQTSCQGSTFDVKPYAGFVDHITVSIYKNGKFWARGNYYLETVLAKTKKVSKVYIPTGDIKRLTSELVKGQEIETYFETSGTTANSSSVKAGFFGKGTAVEAGSESSFAETRKRGVSIRTFDDKKSVMFETSQLMIVVTVTETTYIDTSGHIRKKLKFRNSREMLVTVEKARPIGKGNYGWTGGARNGSR